MTDVRLIQIKEADIEAVVGLSQQIPEFNQPHDATEYKKRLTGVNHLILIAYIEEQPIGFKVGYERAGHFYSWMGGVLPAYRRLGVAQALADAQETWARSQGYLQIIFKTRNRHKAMLLFAIKNGFNMIEIEKRDAVQDYRILLQKYL